MLTGEIGCGKTTLSEHFLLGLHEEEFDIGIINYPCLEPLEMLKEINTQLGLRATDDSRGSMLHCLQQRLAENAAAGKTTLICIDEAQSIPSLQTFEELRLLLNFKLPGYFLLTLLLVGQPELRKKINALPQLGQRIAMHLHLGPLSPVNTARYILHRLHVAGCPNPILTKQAVRAIYRHTHGIPRKINHLADCCLMLGMQRGARFLTAQLVHDARARYFN